MSKARVRRSASPPPGLSEPPWREGEADDAGVQENDGEQ